MDSSRVSTFFISILLIVYGSFRSLAMEEGGEGEEEKKREASNITTLDSLQAMCLPLGASVSLLIMFFFFDSMQVIGGYKKKPGIFGCLISRTEEKEVV
jgi:signal peptide peptidase-like protein 3